MHLNALRCITTLNEDIQFCQATDSPPALRTGKKIHPCCATITTEQLEVTSRNDHVDQRDMSSRFVAPQICKIYQNINHLTLSDYPKHSWSTFKTPSLENLPHWPHSYWRKILTVTLLPTLQPKSISHPHPDEVSFVASPTVHWLVRGQNPPCDSPYSSISPRRFCFSATF